MSDSHGHSRVCPTRIDGGAALFTHRVTVPQCEERQRGRYHKCYSCAYNNQHFAQNGEPVQTSQPTHTFPGSRSALAPEEPVQVEPKRGPVAAQA